MSSVDLRFKAFVVDIAPRSRCGAHVGQCQIGIVPNPEFFGWPFREAFQPIANADPLDLFLTWVDGPTHSAMSYAWQAAWDEFIVANPTATVSKILQFGRMLAADYGLSLNY